MIDSVVSPAMKPNALKDVLSSRALPGVLILSRTGELLYYNEKACQLLSTNVCQGELSESIPEEVFVQCDQLQDLGDEVKDKQSRFIVSHQLIKGQEPYAYRLFLLNEGGEQSSPNVMVLIERLSTRKILNKAALMKSFQVSKREIEVIEVLLNGYSNKKIADVLCISEYTAEDHLKNIMRKMCVKNRLSIVSKALKL